MTMPAYAPPVSSHAIDLKLDANEGRPSPASLLAELAAVGAETFRRYPSTRALERQLAERLGVPVERVCVTGGGDDAIDRFCRAFIGSGDRAIMPAPTFEMIPRYVAAAGAAVVEVPWPDGPFPASRFINEMRTGPAIPFVVTPNNPTGAVASAEDIRAIARAAGDHPVCVDLAYTEYADLDLTPVALAEPNVVIIRTFSKAWGLAGLRVGYAVGPEVLIEGVRSAAGPYPVAGPSLAIASVWLERGASFMRESVSVARRERGALRALLGELGVPTVASQANFILARFRDAWAVAERLAEGGIGVRRFPRPGPLADALRISCPCNTSDFERLAAAFRAILSTETPK